MQSTVPHRPVIRFGVFEVDLHSQELRKHGVRLRLSGQPFQVLRVLLERPGELVSRELLRESLWSKESFGDFDHGLNAAVTRLREVIGDSAESPKYVETLPRRGYRFIGAIEPNGFAVDKASREETPATVAPSAPSSGRTRALLRGLALGAGLALLILAALYTDSYFTRRPQTVSVVPFTSLPGLEVAPAFSPDGTRVVFAWDGDPGDGHHGFDLYIKEVGSEQLLRLTNSPAEWIMPAWSPDGRFIAFTREANGASGVYLIPALGGAERKLRSMPYSPAGCNSLSWSADGRYLAHPQVPEESDLYQLTLLDMQDMKAVVTQRWPSCVISGFPAFAPTGHKLAFACTPSWGIVDLYVIPDIGRDAKRVTRLLGSAFGLTWSRDEKEILVGTSRGEADLWRVNVSSGNAEPLQFGADAGWPTIPARANKLAFARYAETSNVWRLNLHDSESAPRQLLASTRFQENPRISPDGKHIVFESSRSGFSEVWMSNAEGKNLVQLTHFNGPLTGSPAWAPDSQKIVFDSRAGGHANIYVMDVDERVPHVVITNLTENSTPSWSHDGNWIYFRSEGSRVGVYKVRREGGDASQVTSSDGYGPIESEDGSTLYYSSGFKDIHVRRVSLETGVDEAIVGIRGGQLISWTVTAAGIYSIERTPEGPVVNLHDSATGNVRLVRRLPNDSQPTPGIGGLSVSSNGDWLLYSQIDERNSDIMLVENFR
jgi:Tol biopolymer transport system component/DNA-binding winged helix-turn-helix (wHTH) protein